LRSFNILTITIQVELGHNLRISKVIDIYVLEITSFTTYWA
jgi:hypothetical protein